MAWRSSRPRSRSPIGQTVTTTFTLNDINTANAVATDTSTSVIATAAPPLTTLVTFNGTATGRHPPAA